MYWIFELCYSCFRVTRPPRDAEQLAALPFGVIVFLPIVSLLVVYGINIFPYESDGLNTLLGFSYIGLPIVAGYFLIIKPFGFRKRVRERGVIIRTYGWGRKILNYFLFLFFFISFVWIPFLVIQIQELIMEM